MVKTLELALVRYYGTKGYTSGRLYADGYLTCYTLEDEVREDISTTVQKWKIDSKTAIPRGRYEVILRVSPKFKRLLPVIQDVDGFTGILMHRGNKTADTAGCILVGLNDGNDKDAWVGNSAVAEAAVLKLIDDAIQDGKRVFITVV